MAFRTSLANQYRKNGHIFISGFDGEYKVHKQILGGSCTVLDTCYTRADAIRTAKDMAMKHKMGFDQKQDLVLEQSTPYGYSQPPRNGYSIHREQIPQRRNKHDPIIRNRLSDRRPNEGAYG